MLKKIRDYIRSMRVATVAVFNTVIFGGLMTLSYTVRGRVHRIPDFFLWMWAKVFVIFSGSRVEVVGQENFDAKKPCVIMANHTSYFDPPFLMYALKKRVKFIMKKELAGIPMFRPALESAGHIFLDTKNPRLAKIALKKASRWLKKGVSVVIFPEGHIVHSDTMESFKKGGFLLALENKVPIIPVAISNTRKAYDLSTSWWKINKQRIRIVIEKPIETTNYTMQKIQELKDSVKEKIELHYNEKPVDGIQNIPIN